MTIHRDEQRGHFVLDLPPTRHKREVVGVDLGGTLHLTTSGAHLTPNEARDLAEALTWWADRKPRAERGLEDVGDEINDLFDLLDGAAS